MELAFSWVMSNGLKDANSQAVLGAIEAEHIFAGQTALFLLPLKQFFDLGVLDDSNALVIIEKPLDYVRQRVIVHGAIFVPQEHGLARRGLCLWLDMVHLLSSSSDILLKLKPSH